MGRFYGGGTVFPQGAPATVPIIRQSAVVNPSNYPVGGVVPASPAGFPPYNITPALIGAPPQKQIVPPLWGNGMAASMVLPGIFSQPVNMNPVVPIGAVPMAASSPVIAFFQSSASNAAAKANTAAAKADISAKRTRETQRKADEAAYHANQTAAKATVDPTPAAAGAANAAAARAKQLQEEADHHAHDAMVHDAAATAAANHAQEVAMKEAAAKANHEAANDAAIAQGDDKAMSTDTPYIWPDGQVGPPSATSDGSTGIPGLSSGVSGYLAPVGGGALAGFLAFGPLGALLGAFAGGGYVYVKNR